MGLWTGGWVHHQMAFEESSWTYRFRLRWEVQSGTRIWELLEGGWSVRSWEWVNQPRLRRRGPGWPSYPLLHSPSFQGKPFTYFQNARSHSDSHVPLT